MSMANILISQSQLESLVKSMKSSLKEEGVGREYLSKQKLFTIATLSYKLWEMMGEDEKIEDWMESQIAQAEQSITAVVKAYVYQDVSDGDEQKQGMGGLDYKDLIIGK